MSLLSGFSQNGGFYSAKKIAEPKMTAYSYQPYKHKMIESEPKKKEIQTMEQRTQSSIIKEPKKVNLHKGLENSILHKGLY